MKEAVMNVGIIGTGAYAIAIASILENKNINLMMRTSSKEKYEELTKTCKYSNSLNFTLNKNITFTMDIAELLEKNEAIIIAIPAKFLNSTIPLMKNHITNQQILIATKGIENQQKMFIHE